jgi:hypothetical protein
MGKELLGGRTYFAPIRDTVGAVQSLKLDPEYQMADRL